MLHNKINTKNLINMGNNPKIKLNFGKINSKIKPKFKPKFTKNKFINIFKLKAKRRKKRNVKKRAFLRLRPFRKPRYRLNITKEIISRKFKIAKLK